MYERKSRPMSAPTATTWLNWAGNERADNAAVTRPNDPDEVAAVIAGATAAGQTVKAVGTGHSFTRAAATSGVRLELGGLSGVVSADTAAGLVTVRAGTTLRQLNAALAGLGLAL